MQNEPAPIEEQDTPTPDEPVETTPVYQPQSFLGELWMFLRVRKKFWLAPIILALLVLALLFFLASNAGIVAPFLYAM